MALQYQRRLLSYLASEGYQPTPIPALARDLRIDDVEDFARALKELEAAGTIRMDQQGRVALPSLEDLGGSFVGSFSRAAKGFGFAQPDQPVVERSVFIPPDATLDAMTGDRVRVEFRRDLRRERSPGVVGKQFVGSIVEILERNTTTFAGEIIRRGDQWLVQPDGKTMTDLIVVRDAEAKNVKPGDKVIVDITHYPEGDYLPEGVISKVLGEAGDPDVETQAVILAHNLPGAFPDACLDQAREITRRFDADIASYERGVPLEGRLDLTDSFIITIDPPSAKDYDDAISIERTKSGWKLGVHIADVGSFIEPGSPLDIEARERGNSVYLPRLVIPMLPEILSNGICSLQEGVLRFAKSAFATYDRDGTVLSEGTASTLIKSAKRLTYLEAQALIDGDPDEARKHAKTDTAYTDQLIEALKAMNTLARAIRARRERQGMISLDLPDVELIFDETGRVVDAQPEDDAFTHTLIEMFMVEANEILARLFEGLGVPLLRRTHPEPTPGDSETLRKVSMVAGFRIPKNPTREELQGLLSATRGTPAARAVHLAVLRTLTKAEYSPALIGHFALASGAYAHFTSPIRRYADLTVHWSLGAYLAMTDNGTKRPTTDEQRAALGRELRGSERILPEADLVALGRHLSMTEDNAESAERELRQFLVLQLLAEKIGEEFDCVVTGVIHRGIFVQLDKYLADGFIKSADLPGDVTRGGGSPHWRLDSKTGALVDANSGRSYNLGDRVRARVASVDLAMRRLELVVADGSSRAAGKAKGLKLGAEGGAGLGGGMAAGKGAGFGSMRTGAQRRSSKSKRRDKGKTDYRKDRKNKRK